MRKSKGQQNKPLYKKMEDDWAQRQQEIEEEKRAALQVDEDLRAQRAEAAAQRLEMKRLEQAALAAKQAENQEFLAEVRGRGGNRLGIMTASRLQSCACKLMPLGEVHACIPLS
jgi:conjugal transfer/entry exclusion protein